ncbi:ATP-grasp domain-containing protein [Roseivirga pacifica]|uniref:ATP-grasp domain-containing protein n=1 Tax=Roseivirga pacifica TaxID=1267423 RepID=UPI003BAFB523
MPEDKQLRVLVTGCGGDIGQSIGKILINYTDRFEVHGVDISDRNAAKFIFPTFSIAPRVNAPEYLDFITKYIATHQIDLVIPIAEPELRYYALNGWNSETIGADVLIANDESLNTGFDKMATVDFLSANGFAFPKTRLIGESSGKVEFPIILKSRTGSGSKSLLKVSNQIEFDFYMGVYGHQDFIIQEFIPSEEGEYTCGLFRSADGETRSIIFQRELMGGFSGYGELIESEIITRMLHELAGLLRLRGSINVQLRLRDGVPYIFEINPRFSSTVYFRHQFGFDDVLWSIADLRGERLAEYKPKRGFKHFYKGFNEYID